MREEQLSQNYLQILLLSVALCSMVRQMESGLHVAQCMLYPDIYLGFEDNS